jgi:hypothetical protein
VETGQFAAVYRQGCIPKEQKHRQGMSHMLETTPLGKTKVNPQNITIVEK